MLRNLAILLEAGATVCPETAGGLTAMDPQAVSAIFTPATHVSPSYCPKSFLLTTLNFLLKITNQP